MIKDIKTSQLVVNDLVDPRVCLSFNYCVLQTRHMPGSGFSMVGVVTKQMESGLQGAYTRQTRTRKRHRVVTEERNRQAGPGAGNVRRKKDASGETALVFRSEWQE